MKKVLIICGPTATGKTSLASSLAERWDGELVSADSRQVYQGMDIGTGKDKGEVAVPLWLVDLVSPKEQFSVFDWLILARAKIKDIWKRGRLPIVVGGTGLYLKALVDGIETLAIPPDKKLRKELGRLNLEELQRRLKRTAPQVFASLNQSDRNNPRRLVRKIEIALSKKERSGFGPLEADFLMIGLTAPKDLLYRRIDYRVEKRVEMGLIDEIRGLLKKGIHWFDPGMNTLAYKEFKAFFEGKESWAEAVQRWRFDEHGYARRQITWFKRDDRIRWFNIAQKGFKEKVKKLVEKWYSKENGTQHS